MIIVGKHFSNKHYLPGTLLTALFCPAR